MDNLQIYWCQFAPVGKFLDAVMKIAMGDSKQQGQNILEFLSNTSTSAIQHAA